ncbi:unnamed protein product [Pocillopora meandrina]|uniref:Uncharacterized protein n=1 Tax=Pocillopora meandrina TaxID=46732 RepID=A0AAU9W2Q3_9CNID|nr:unnamed protein product [Pocillopora meandrina]
MRTIIRNRNDKPGAKRSGKPNAKRDRPSLRLPTVPQFNQQIQDFCRRVSSYFAKSYKRASWLKNHIGETISQSKSEKTFTS